MKTDCCQILKPFGIAALLFALSAAGAQDYDVAAYVWPAYQPEPRWAELGIFKAGKGEWQSVWEAQPRRAGAFVIRGSFDIDLHILIRCDILCAR